MKDMNEDEKAVWTATFGSTVAQVWALDARANSWAEALSNLVRMTSWVTPLPAMVADKAVELYREMKRRELDEQNKEKP